MANITKSSDAGVVNPEYLKPQTRKAGEEIAAGDAVYLDSNNRWLKAVRTVQFATGTYGTVMKFAGLAPKAIPSGTLGEVYGDGAEFFYADSAAVANDNPVAMVISDTNIKLIRGV